ncbi:DUF3826 domain-containing protein [Niabella soli]|uniref:DUF3826 domain-containing protein n=1 Tax=Niabella soli DSM 19437 TaxID=929713 RepID=W0F665_9BACT|nr:DUF3826 domain-containing protein [Niabella soli]AHF16846.1 hypothetical protein NIASO_20035 [Niabella soli DSM 19437]
MLWLFRKEGLRFIGKFALTGMLIIGVAHAQSDEAAIAYKKSIEARAYKIVTPLDLKDSVKFYKVRDVVAKQYIELSAIDARDAAAVKTIKNAAKDKAATDAALADQQKKLTAEKTQQHKVYLTQLSKYLDAGQIDVIKNGMTYNVLPLTYKGYLEMIPRLTTEEKQYIMNALVEARELAIDAGSSEKKHAWFGKYKGRINNYLSSHGYDVNKESKAWQERMKTQQAHK